MERDPARHVSRCILPKHRQECLCHTRSRLYPRFRKYGTIDVAQTLVSVLVRLGTSVSSRASLISGSIH
jgi:hypothetical protein